MSTRTGSPAPRPPAPIDRAEALFRWRRAQLDAGVEFDLLPVDTDLYTIAWSSETLQQQLGTLRFVAPDRVRRFANEIADALGQGVSSPSAASGAHRQTVPGGQVRTPGAGSTASVWKPSTPARAREEALFRWRRDRNRAGVALGQLPGDDDLRRIAGSPAVTAEQVAKIASKDIAVLRRHAEEISTVLQSAMGASDPRPPAGRSRHLGEPPPAEPPTAEPPTAGPPTATTTPDRPSDEPTATSTSTPTATPTATPTSTPTSTPRTPTADAAKARPARPRGGAAGTAPAVGPDASAAPLTGGAPGDSEAFARYDPAHRDRSRSPVGVSVQVRDDGSLRYAWRPPVGAPVFVVRVVTRDDRAPDSPEGGTLVTVVGGHDAAEATDTRPCTATRRHVEVWVNQGRSAEEARAAQPYLHARSSYVFPVTDCTVSTVARHVSGHWRPVSTDALRVDVQRVPVDVASKVRYDDRYAITAVDGNRGGFDDVECRPGETYEYRVFVVAASDGGEEYSPPTVRLVTLAASLEAVLDLRVLPVPERDDEVSVEWTAPPVGVVQIYLSAKPPTPGADKAELTEDRLESAELMSADLIRQPVRSTEGRCHIRLVPLPPQIFGRIYLTPVTVHAGRARVGPPATILRIGHIREPRLVQRVSFQLLTFGWPDGAAEVYVYLTPRGSKLADVPGEPIAWLDAAGYRRVGGIRLSQGELPPDGCDVHLVPVAYHGGPREFGPPGTVRYSGLTTARYRLAAESRAPGFLRRLRRRRTLEVQPDSDVALHVSLVHHPSHLPLSSRDGTTLQTFDPQLNRGLWSPLGEFEMPEQGFVRVFAQPHRHVQGQARTFALLDPPAEQLRCGR